MTDALRADGGKGEAVELIIQKQLDKYDQKREYSNVACAQYNAVQDMAADLVSAAQAECAPREAQPDWMMGNVLGDIARQCARKSEERHDYLPFDAESERQFLAHKWVKDAMVAAINWDRKMNRTAAQADTLPIGG